MFNKDNNSNENILINNKINNTIIDNKRNNSIKNKINYKTIINKNRMLNRINDKLDEGTTNSIFILSIPLAIFLPYILSTIVMIGLAVYVIKNTSIRKQISSQHNFRALALFFMYGISVSLYHGNWLGFAAGMGFFMAFIIGQNLRMIMTESLFEKSLNMMAYLSVVASIWAICEVYLIPYITKGKAVNRASAMFFYPNYFGNIISIVVLICIYKLLTNQGKASRYIGIIGMNVISIYLCKSMFAWVEIVAGTTLLLFFLGKFKLLVAWISTALTAGFMILVMNLDLIPRLSEAKLTTALRVDIWKYALNDIGEHIFFGRGFMPYLHMDTEKHMGFIVPHSHSIFLEILLSVGVIGLIVIAYFIIGYSKSLLLAYKMKTENKIYTIIIAILGASFIHGIADLTLMWVQTLPLFIFILCGIGTYENRNPVKVRYRLVRDYELNLYRNVCPLYLSQYSQERYSKVRNENKKLVS